MAESPLEFTPQQIVAELNKYIIGQDDAKRSVAIALRNRYRRRKLPADLRDEVVPKNILMIGPTGVGKTEIARRLARLARAPFVKVEATKFTEVGYVGRDVEGMVRDLVETAIRIVQQERLEQVQDRARFLAGRRLVDIVAPLPSQEQAPRNPLAALFGTSADTSKDSGDDFEQRLAAAKARRRQVEDQLQAGQLEDELVEIEVEDTKPRTMDVFSGAGMEEMSINLQDLFGGLMPKQKRQRKVAVKEARAILQQEEAHKLIDMDQVTAEAVRRAEEAGIIFIDEIDKIAGRGGMAGPDVSREGVQRDILPIVEGSTVQTKYGPVKTDHVLFICAGAFHVSKPSDLIPELQGRFPIRVELTSLGKEEFRRILREPKNALIKQYIALLATDGVHLEFTADGIDEVAAMAWQVNQQTENIGARRLHTLLEKIIEDVSFLAPEDISGYIRIDALYVRQRLQHIIKDTDLSRYIL